MKHIYVLLSILLSFSFVATAQDQCSSLLTNEYLSDGQYYASLINFGEVRSCDVTLLAGNEYRIIVCSHQAKNVRMQLVDKQGNILFDNKNYSYTNNWNFVIRETINCDLKLQLSNKDVEVDEIVVLIGYKK